MGDLWQQAFPLHYDTIRRPEIFNDKRVAAPPQPCMVATHMVLGQTEKTLRMAPNICVIGQRQTFSTVKSLKYFQVRHSLYPSFRRRSVDHLSAFAFLSAPGMGHLRASKTLQGVKFSRYHVDTFSNADMDCASVGGDPCITTIGT
jgi:hypothetical protein